MTPDNYATDVLIFGLGFPGWIFLSSAIGWVAGYLAEKIIEKKKGVSIYCLPFIYEWIWPCVGICVASLVGYIIWDVWLEQYADVLRG